MLHISILEDNPTQLDQIQQAVKRICTTNNIDYSVHGFRQTADLLTAVPEPSASNVFILDLEINGHRNAGLLVSQKLRFHDPAAAIIFITVHEEFMYRTYKYRVGALDFIAKDYGHIEQELQKDLLHVHQANLKIANAERPFTYTDYNHTINIAFNKINLIESNPHNSHSAILSTVDHKQRQLNYNLRQLEKMDSRLLRVHRSFLINPHQVNRVDLRHKIVHFYNGDTCPVSRLHLSHLLNTVS